MVRFLPPVIVVTALFASGCGKSRPPLVPIKGTVTLDKRPLAEGNILFITPGQPPETLPIKDGAFEGMVQAGERRVEILAYKEAAPVPMKDVTFEPSKANYRPARYNTQSELKETVTPAGPNEFKYDLTSK